MSLAETIERDRSILYHASDDELEIIVAALEAEVERDKRDWVLTPKQQRAEILTTNLDPSRAHELLYGGAAGGGKSQWMLWHLYHLALKYPGFSGLMLRKTFRQLVRTQIKMSYERFDRTLCKWNQVDKIWKFKNGSTIEFGYLDKSHDIYNYDSAEYDVVAWDELTQWGSDENYRYLFSRIRTERKRTEMGLVGHMIASTNPGRAGGAWVKARFIDVGPELVPVETVDDQTGAVTTRVFVPATISDNPHYNRAQYRASLANVDEKRRRQLELGDWDAVEGQYFHEWNRAIHVIPPFEIPDYWPRIRGLDFGYTNPMACPWIAFDGDGVGYVYRELYGTQMLPAVQARRILEMSAQETIAYTMADPSAWARTGAGDPISAQWARAGLRCRKADNARVDGWTILRSYLRIDETTGMPRLLFFDWCVNTLRTLPMLVHDDDNPEDLDTEGEDHMADALRYALMSRPKAAKTPRGPLSGDEVAWETQRRSRRHDRSHAKMHPDLGRF